MYNYIFSQFKLSTVNRISIIISFYTCILMIVLGIVFNVWYFLTRHPQEQAILEWLQQDSNFATSLPNNENMRENLTWRDVLFQWGGSQNIKTHNQSRYYFISNTSPDYTHITRQIKLKNNKITVVSHNGYDFMTRPIDWWALLVDISGYKEKEDMLLTLTLILLFFMVGTIFFITRILITRSLRDLTELETYTNNLNADIIAQQLLFSHLTSQDPIQRLSQAIFNFHTEQFTYTENMRQFMSSIAHEIKTPLQVIQTKVDPELGQNTRSKNIVVIEQQINHINDLVDVLSNLTFSQYKKLNFESLDVNLIISDIVRDFEIRHSKYKRVYTSEIWNYIKKGNKTSITTIVSNILQNGVKYSNPWSTISIAVSEDACIISDQGIGMNDQELTHIREPFRQADTSRGKDSWFWLWLTLVKKLAWLQWRNIQCKSTKNKGTIFTLSR